MIATLRQKEQKTKHRAVAPVIATLLMVAIAVVGGTIIFVFSQGFFSSSQISGTPTIESLEILGYDARGVTDLQAENGQPLSSSGPLSQSSGDVDGVIEADERIVIYVTNDSVQKVMLAEVRFAGTVYNYTTLAGNALTDWNDAGATSLSPGRYAIIVDTPTGADSEMLGTGGAEIQQGETVTLVLDLDSDMRTGRSSQFQMTTSNGNTVVSTVNIGRIVG